VLIAGGIYRVENLGFGPRGEGPARMTVFKAAPGARPVFSRPDDKCPQVGLDSYVRIQGLWFGGSGMRAGKTIFAPGSGNGGKEIIGCTIFGYEGGILIGTSFNLLLHGNRLVHCGSGHFSHGIYLSGGANPNCSHHAIVDRNVLVAGEGYGLHGWHAPMSMFLSRNVVAAHSYGIVMAGPDADTPYDGEDHVVVNNFVWKSKGATSGPNGLHCAGQNMIWENNLCGPNCRAIGNFGAATNQVQCNGFLGVAAVGKTPLAIGRAQMDAVLGVSEAAYDGAIAALDKAFNAPVEEIHKDTTIEQAFAQMWPRIPAGSPAHNYGPAWFGDLAKRVNLGPDTPAPLTKEAFWNAFRKLGRKDWERHARKSNQGPVVDAGPDQAVNASTATLNGSVTDSDGGTCKTVWAKLSGPGTVTFADASAPQTAVSFSAPGAYVLHLSADKGGPKDDGILYAGECVTIAVQAGGGRVAEGGSRATTAGPPAAVDAKALETWRARLRERVQKGVQEGAQPRVSLTLLEAQPTAVKIARADAKGLT
jgi:hypothetical protein